MFSTKRWFIPLGVVLTSFVAASAAYAQGPAAPRDPTCPYTLASLQGSYSVVASYGANVGLGLWTETLDGQGNLTRTGVLNYATPGSTTGERTLGTVSSTGTYTVHCDGTGTMTRMVTRPDGTTVPEADDFIITASTRLLWHPAIATTIVDAQRVPSAIVSGGIFVTHVHTRLPDTVYGLSSFLP